jgi:hypothetical protein
MVHSPERTINRYYDPATGQFVSVDPMVNETDQPYAYAEDDPVNAVDPSGDGGYGAYFDEQNAAEYATYCHAHNNYCQCGDPSVDELLATVEIGGALIATIATDGATSELLAESISIAISEDSSTVVLEDTVLETASQTSTLGKVAGGVSLVAAGNQTVRDCFWGTKLTCALDLATLGIGLRTLTSSLSAMEKVWTALAASLPSSVAFLKLLSRECSQSSLSNIGSCTIGG